ncbi:MAG: DUF4011 domain-containing protein, partial [Pseudoclavibacter sp.]
MQPNDESLAHVIDPAVDPVLDAIRAKATMPNGTSGASGTAPRRQEMRDVAKIAAAVFAAVSSLELEVVADPARPPSEAADETSDGPRHDHPGPAVPHCVRAPAAIMAGGRATPLELATLVAAGLERAGARPVIVRANGSALVGTLTVDRVLADDVATDLAELTEFAKTGELAIADAHTVSREYAAPLRDGARAAARWFVDGAPGFVDAVDVAAAREHVRPVGAAQGRRRTGDDRFAEWTRSILDLSMRNPLLNLSPARGLTLQTGEATLEELVDLLGQGSGQPVPVRGDDEFEEFAPSGDGADAVAPPTSATEAGQTALDAVFAERGVMFARTPRTEVDQTLRRLQRDAKRIVTETGSNDLFLALGSLRWRDRFGDRAHAPLMLLPVTIDGERGGPYAIRYDDAAELVPNECLYERLRFDYGVELDALRQAPEPNGDGLGARLRATVADVRAGLDAQLDRLGSHGPDFVLAPRAQLTVLQFTTLDLWRDVERGGEMFRTNRLVRHLVETPGAAFEQPAPVDRAARAALGSSPGRAAHGAGGTAIETRSFLPVPADGSQLRAIDRSALGESFVLEGPPGTGKSQTITNMIANAVAMGRTVAFVAEKQAALDIVKRNLKRAGLERVALDIHGRNLSRRGVRDQLRAAWSARFESDADALEALHAQYSAVIEALDAHPVALTAEGPAGLSLRDTQRRIDALESTATDAAKHSASATAVSSDVAQGRIPFDEAIAAGRRLEQALDHARRTGAVDAWSLMGRTSGERAGFATVAGHIKRVYSSLEQLPAPLRRMLEELNDPIAWLGLSPWLADLDAGRAISVAEFERHGGAVWANDLRWLAGELRALSLGDIASGASADDEAGRLAARASELGVAEAAPGAAVPAAVLAGTTQREV